MKLNKFIFPAPTSSYSANQLLGEIIYIPRSLDYPKPSPPLKKSSNDLLKSNSPQKSNGDDTKRLNLLS